MSKRVGIKSSGSLKGIDGTPASLGTPSEIQKGCTLCGAVGHKASAHSDGKAVVDSDDDGHGPAKDMNKATQFGNNTSQYMVGSPNYKPPGSRGGKS